MGWSGKKNGDSRKILKQKTKALKELQIGGGGRQCSHQKIKRRNRTHNGAR
jgi:hypothetical protein